MSENSTPTPEQQVSEQDVRAHVRGLWIHEAVQIRWINNHTLSFVNRETGETLTLTAKGVKPEHTHLFVGSPDCPGCTWERIGPPPVRLSILKGNRP